MPWHRGRPESRETRISGAEWTKVDNAELSRDLHELRELEAAKARLDAGSFGQCIDCHEAIEYSRLRAQPAALRCVDCQRIHESTHTHPATPRL